MCLKTKIPRTALASGRGKSGENIKANYLNHFTKIFVLKLPQKISCENHNRLVAKRARRIAQSMARERRGL